MYITLGKRDTISKILQQVITRSTLNLWASLMVQVWGQALSSRNPAKSQVPVLCALHGSTGASGLTLFLQSHTQGSKPRFHLGLDDSVGYFECLSFLLWKMKVTVVVSIKCLHSCKWHHSTVSSTRPEIKREEMLLARSPCSKLSVPSTTFHNCHKLFMQLLM